MNNPQILQITDTPETASTCYFVYPGDLNTASGGYRYDREIIDGLRQLGWQVSRVSLPGTYPKPDEAAVKSAQSLLETFEPGQVVIVDGLALGALPKQARFLAQNHHLVALVHHPLFLENGLSEEDLTHLHQSEREALRFATHVIVTSPATADSVAKHMQVAPEKISVVLPGVDRPTLSVRATKSSELQTALLCVGSVVPRKGQVHLVEALSGLRELNWRLDLIGETSFDPDYAAHVQSLIEDYLQQDRITLHGGISKAELLRYYECADIFVLPTFYEGYGMAFAEALSYGLPIVASGEGAVATTVPEDAGLHVPAGNPDALRDGLKRLIDQPLLREQLQAGALRAAQDLPGWDVCAAQFATVLKRIT